MATCRAVMPLVVAQGVDGGQVYAYQGEPVGAISDDEAQRLLAKGAIAEVQDAPKPAPRRTRAED